MANINNLVKGDEIHKFTPEEASKGGRNSAKARREKRDLKRAMEILLDREFDGKNGEKISGAEAIAIKQFEKALQGDAKAFELVRDTSGQKPIDKIVVAEIDAEIIDEVESMVLGDDYGQEND